MSRDVTEVMHVARGTPSAGEQAHKGIVRHVLHQRRGEAHAPYILAPTVDGIAASPGHGA